MMDKNGDKYLTLSDNTNNINTGIIFIKGKGPLDRISQIITKFNKYSSIGVYYRSSITGKSKIHILRTYTTGIRKKEWLEKEETLDELLNNPLIDKISIREIIDKSSIEKTKELQLKFRTALIKLINNNNGSNDNESSIKDTIINIFNYDPIELINNILRYVNDKDTINKNIINYLYDDISFIGPLQHIKLNRYELTQIELSYNKEFKSDILLFKEHIHTFFDMVVNDHEFYNYISKNIIISDDSINNTIINNDLIINNYDNNNFILLESGIIILECINQCWLSILELLNTCISETHVLKIDNLEKLLDRINFILTSIFKQLNKERNYKINLDITRPRITLYSNKLGDGYIPHDRNIDYKIHTYNNVKCINKNILIKIFNDLGIRFQEFVNYLTKKNKDGSIILVELETRCNDISLNISTLLLEWTGIYSEPCRIYNIDSTIDIIIYRASKKEELRKIVNLKNNISQINDSIKNSIIPVIDINALITDINNILISYGEETIDKISGESSYNSLVVVTNTTKDKYRKVLLDSTISLNMPDKGKYIIPLHNAKLKQFNIDELTEILNYVDTISDDTKKFDVLRYELTQEIARKL